MHWILHGQKRAVILLLSLVLASFAITAPTSSDAGTPLKAGVFDPPLPAPEFSLRGSDGRPVTLTRYRGKIVLLYFGYTTCAAVCPTTLATLAQSVNSLGEVANAVQVVFVTVDPERDDIAQMKDYLEAFDPSFVGATAEPEALAAVRRSYGVTVTKHVTKDGYVLDHTSSIYLIDPAGKLRAVMPYGHDADDFVHDIKLLLVQ
jgi:protein SCO1/2